MIALLKKFQKKSNSWSQTDDYQWVKEEGNRQYWVIDIVFFPNDEDDGKPEDYTYYVKDITVYMDDFTDEELEEEVSAYYPDGLKEVKETYGEHWEGIVAECIAENEYCDLNNTNFDTLKELAAYLKERYGIENYNDKEVPPKSGWHTFITKMKMALSRISLIRKFLKTN
ncbi:hypothetical protein CN918_30185 [Priestia megaterium]|nr:hypothetical protein CN918_30185 [Priestia megaterium]